MIPGAFAPTHSLGVVILMVTWVARLAACLVAFALWAVAESLLRDTVPGFTTSLDTFAAGRLGPRGF